MESFIHPHPHLDHHRHSHPRSHHIPPFHFFISKDGKFRFVIEIPEQIITNDIDIMLEFHHHHSQFIPAVLFDHQLLIRLFKKTLPCLASVGEEAAKDFFVGSPQFLVS